MVGFPELLKIRDTFKAHLMLLIPKQPGTGYRKPDTSCHPELALKKIYFQNEILRSEGSACWPHPRPHLSFPQQRESPRAHCINNDVCQLFYVPYRLKINPCN